MMNEYALICKTLGSEAGGGLEDAYTATHPGRRAATSAGGYVARVHKVGGGDALGPVAKRWARERDGLHVHPHAQLRVEAQRRL